MKKCKKGVIFTSFKKADINNILKPDFREIGIYPLNKNKVFKRPPGIVFEENLGQIMERVEKCSWKS